MTTTLSNGFRDLLIRIKENNLAEAMGFWYIVLLTGYRNNIDYERGASHFQESMPQIQSQEDPWVHGYCMLAAGGLPYRVGNFGDDKTAKIGKDLILEALAIFQKIGVVHEQGMTLQLLGDFAHSEGDFERAIQYKRDAQTLFEKVGDQMGVGFIWFDLADLYFRRGLIEEGFHAYKKTRQLYERIGNRRMIGMSLSWESLAASRYSTFSHALETRLRSLDLAREAGNQHDYNWHAWELGEIYRLMGDYNQARKWYQESYNFFEQLNLYSGLGFYHRGFGDIALGLGHWEEACRCFTEAIDCFGKEKRGSRAWGLAYAHAGLGRAFIGLEEPAQAEEQLTQALVYAVEWETISDPLKFLPLLGFTALFYATGKYREAVELAVLITHYPTTWNEIRNLAGEILEAASKELPASVKEEAEKKGETLALEQMVTKLLARKKPKTFA